MINRIGQVQTAGKPSAASGKKEPVRQGRFQELLAQKSGETHGPAASQSINFSKHAMTRVEERGIQITQDLIDRLAGSVERAQAKGATNILAFDTNQAFIINVPHGRVITTMTQAEMKENCFTNIDGAVIL